MNHLVIISNLFILLEPLGRISFELHPPGGRIEASKTGLTGVLPELFQTIHHGINNSAQYRSRLNFDHP